MAAKIADVKINCQNYKYRVEHFLIEIKKLKKDIKKAEYLINYSKMCDMFDKINI